MCVNNAGRADDSTPAPLRAGDERTLGLLYRAHAPAVAVVARRILLDRDAADDIVQDVFLHLWQHPESYEPHRGPIRTWLCVVARHRAIDRLRRLQLERSRLPVMLADSYPHPSTEDTTLHGELLDAVRVAVAGLSAPYRDAVLLAYYRGMTYREVAVELGLAEGTAKSRLRRALHSLGERLAAQGLAYD